MPLGPNTPARLLNQVPSGVHIIDRRARFDAPQTQPPLGQHRDRWNTACENFAVRALQVNAIDPPSVFMDILMHGVMGYAAQNPLHAAVNHAEYARYRLIRQTVNGIFGNFNQYNIGPLPPHSHNPLNHARRNAKRLRNANRANLHTLTAEVFEMCLRYNGFTLSPNNAVTDFCVCTEYECAGNQPMYPNHTHSWLMWRRRRIIQKITGSHISVSRHQAGRPPHSGFIRRYVTDFHANQNTIIDEIMSGANRVQARPQDPVVGCWLHEDCQPPVATDEHSPDE